MGRLDLDLIKYLGLMLVGTALTAKLPHHTVSLGEY